MLQLKLVLTALNFGQGAGKMVISCGGIDKIQFSFNALLILLSMTHSPTNFIWEDTFMTNALIQKQIPSYQQYYPKCIYC